MLSKLEGCHKEIHNMLWLTEWVTWETNYPHKKFLDILNSGAEDIMTNDITI